MHDGVVTLWDSKKILDGTFNMNSLKMGRGCVSANKIDKEYSEPINSIEFNPHKKNLLAAGCKEVLIQDIASNIKSPTVFKAGSPNYHEGSSITSISWNRIVPHILASSSENGKICVWDLKMSKPIFTFTEPTAQSSGLDDYFGGSDQAKPPVEQKKQTQMMWNPEIPTQFVVANDDDQNPTINVWDLRNPDYPVATYNDIHYNGILSFSWCISDAALVASTGKDNRTVITNFKTGERVLEFPTQKTFKKIKWSDNLHGKLAGMDDEGNVSVLSLEPEGLFSNPGRQYATPCISAATKQPYMPKWKVPKKSGAKFGFGNKLVTFGAKSGSNITIHKKPMNPSLVERV